VWSAYFKQRKKKRSRGFQMDWTLVHSLDREGLLSVLTVGFYIFTLANKRQFARMENNLGRCGE
jgi:hypothetical protein